MKARILIVLFVLICMFLLAKDVFYITEFESKTEYEIEYMLDSELHTWVGKKEYIDIHSEKFDLILSILQKNKGYVDKLENQLETSNKQVEDLQNQLESMTASVTNLQTSLHERDRLIADLENQLRKR